MAGSINSMGVSPAFFAPRQFYRYILGFVAAVVALGAVSPLEAQRRHGNSPLDTLGEEVSQADGFEILNTFRRLGIVGEYRLSFQLRVMPRGERTTTVPGVLLGTMTQSGPLSRVDIALEPADVTDKGELIPPTVQRILLQNGIFANALEARSDQAGSVGSTIGSEQYFEPIAGSDFTVFDLLMPFSYWQRFLYEGRTTKRGRPCHVFMMRPPEEDEVLQTRVSGVRIYLDEEFNALIRVEIFDSEGEKEKTIEVVSFKVVDGQGVLSQIDVRNEKTRDKTRFKVTDTALGVELPEWVFDVEGLSRNVYGTELALVTARAESEAAEAAAQ